jgi:Bacterial flagellin C-terminal helical region
MVINTNLNGTGGTPLAKPNGRPVSNSKTANPLANPAGAVTLDSQINRIFASAGSEIEDSDAAHESTQAARTGILGQPGTAMLAQANLSPEMVLKLLQE